MTKSGLPPARLHHVSPLIPDLDATLRLYCNILLCPRLCGGVRTELVATGAPRSRSGL